MGNCARIKQAVRRAISLSGGIDGAAATAGRQRSVVGDWNNLSHAALPNLDCALSLDEVAVATGNAPPIVSALARALGGLFVPHLDAEADEDTLPGEVMKLAKEFGELAASVSTGLADGEFSESDAEAALAELIEVELVAARLRAMLMAKTAKGLG